MKPKRVTFRLTLSVTADPELRMISMMSSRFVFWTFWPLTSSNRSPGNRSTSSCLFVPLPVTGSAKITVRFTELLHDWSTSSQKFKPKRKKMYENVTRVRKKEKNQGENERRNRPGQKRKKFSPGWIVGRFFDHDAATERKTKIARLFPL